MSIKRISTVSTGMNAAGPYSLAVVAEGKFVFISGMGPWCPKQKKLVGGSVAEQTELTLAAMEAALHEAGATRKDVVSCRVFLSQLTERNFKAMNEVYDQFFGDHRPVRTTVGCQLLNIDVEIDCIARIEG